MPCKRLVGTRRVVRRGVQATLSAAALFNSFAPISGTGSFSLASASVSKEYPSPYWSLMGLAEGMGEILTQ